VLIVSADIGVLFSGSREHFQIWKYAHFQMKNRNKIGEKSEKNKGWVVMTLGNGFRVQGTFSNLGIVAMQK
jgi:hypothetical protein